MFTDGDVGADGFVAFGVARARCPLGEGFGVKASFNRFAQSGEEVCEDGGDVVRHGRLQWVWRWASLSLAHERTNPSDLDPTG